MDLLQCIILVILFRTTTAKYFVIFENATTWVSATDKCELAVPELKFTKDEIKVTTVLNIDVNDGEEIWVGYYQALTAFEYFGCAEKPDGPKIEIKKEDPGQCMSACGANKRIGIYKKKCFCLEMDEPENVDTMSPYCNDECDDAKGIVCGGDQNEKNYISIYRSIGMDTVSMNGTGTCMYYDHNGFHWGNCTMNYAFICEKGSSAWIQTGGVNTPVYKDNGWTSTTIACFQNKTRPSTFNNTRCLHTKNSTPQLWTGIVRSQVIHKYTNGPSHFRRASNYGYIQKDVLKFANVDDQKKFLCVHGTIRPPSSTAAYSAPNNSTSSVTKTTTTDAPVCSSNMKKKTPKGGSSDVGAIVGAILAFVIVVVVVIGVILFLRKRGIKLPFLKKDKQSPTSANVHNNSYMISRPVKILQSTYRGDQNEYAEIDLTTTTDNEANNGVPNGATEKSNYAHDYFVLEKVEEETFDSTQHDVQKSDPNTFNPYNKLSFEKGSNYDHVGVGAGNAGSKMSDSENTYNTTSLGNSYLKKSADVQNKAYNMTEDPEDTYNHTNIPMRQTGLRDSENDYDAI